MIGAGQDQPNAGLPGDANEGIELCQGSLINRVDIGLEGRRGQEDSGTIDAQTVHDLEMPGHALRIELTPDFGGPAGVRVVVVDAEGDVGSAGGSLNKALAVRADGNQAHLGPGLDGLS